MGLELVKTGTSVPSARGGATSLPVTRFGRAPSCALPLVPFVSESNAPALLAQAHQDARAFMHAAADARNFDAAICPRTLAHDSNLLAAWHLVAAGGSLRAPGSIRAGRPKASNGERRPAGSNGRPARASSLKD